MIALVARPGDRSVVTRGRITHYLVRVRHMSEHFGGKTNVFDEVGMGRTQGEATIARAAAEMAAGGKLRPFYELSHIYSDQMPLSPFAEPISIAYKATEYMASHAGNGDTISGQAGSQGTKIDALGHFGYVADDGVTTYYGGLTQDQVKPAESSPLLHLGIEHAPPIVTTALLLDARRLKGRTLTAGEQVTAAGIAEMITAQGVREPVAGDALFIYTGWEERWPAHDPDAPPGTGYYGSGPGLSRDAAEYLASKEIVCIGMDVPFIDAVSEGFLAGTAGAAEGAPPGLPFIIHHHNLTQAGIYQVHNMHLSELAADEVYLSAVFVLPLRIRGSVNSTVRPVAIGRPHGQR
jgi:kynurenine formamidase